MSRPVGSQNKDKAVFREKMASLNCDPETFLAMILTNTLPCFCVDKEQLSTDECKICNGTGFERAQMKQRVSAGIRLMDSLQPRLASKTVVKDTRKVILARLNHMADKDQGKVSKIIEGERGSVDES